MIFLPYNIPAFSLDPTSLDSPEVNVRSFNYLLNFLPSVASHLAIEYRQPLQMLSALVL